MPKRRPEIAVYPPFIFYAGAMSIDNCFADFSFGHQALQAILEQMPTGIVIAEVFYVFPHVLMILVTALATADARLYEAAEAMGTSARRKFLTITLPGACDCGDRRSPCRIRYCKVSDIAFALGMRQQGIAARCGRCGAQRNARDR